jgi:hypothetical protein
MRCLAALQTCIALLLGFFVAPFQHVHNGHGGVDHDHSALIHAHFYHLSAVPVQRHGMEILDADDDDHAAASSLDTFTLVLTAGFSAFIPLRAPGLPLVLPETFDPVEIVEERGHDPPCTDHSPPRAPPS